MPDPFESVDPTDFTAMIDVRRYGRRSPEFDTFIARTHEHYWNPEDPDYVDFSADLPANATIIGDELVPELRTAVADRLDEGQRIQLNRDVAFWVVSQLLHGEQAALSLSSNLVDTFLDPGAQEYMANQVREEARHVRAFSMYIERRFASEPAPPSEGLRTLAVDLVSTQAVWKKVVGMQLIIEGLAMGAFASIHRASKDPLLCRLVQLAMTDEAFHHRFGNLWAEKVLPTLDAQERLRVELWAAVTFQKMAQTLSGPSQRTAIYEQHGLDPKWVVDALREAMGGEDFRRELLDNNLVYRVLAQTFLKAGLVTDRTRHVYANVLDLEEIEQTLDEFPAAEALEAGYQDLREINARKRTVIKRLEPRSSGDT